MPHGPLSYGRGVAEGRGEVSYSRSRRFGIERAAQVEGNVRLGQRREGGRMDHARAEAGNSRYIGVGEVGQQWRFGDDLRVRLMDACYVTIKVNRFGMERRADYRRRIVGAVAAQRRGCALSCAREIARQHRHIAIAQRSGKAWREPATGRLD